METLYHLNTSPALFVFNYLSDGAWLLPMAGLGPWSSYVFLPHNWEYRCAQPCTGLFVEMEAPVTFYPGWTGTMVLPISASRIAEIACVHHHTFPEVIVHL
jgi:hypothetical protein